MYRLRAAHRAAPRKNQSSGHDTHACRARATGRRFPASNETYFLARDPNIPTLYKRLKSFIRYLTRTLPTTRVLGMTLPP
eukprot:6560085-Prymnesium_polylepis.1